jgi:hypothetical protein
MRFSFVFAFVGILGCASSRSSDKDPNDGGIIEDVELGEGGCGATCSSDLHAVVDCNGNVLVQCADDQGCTGQRCVPACDAAKTNKSTMGCDYFTFSTDMFIPGGCLAVYVANTWGSPVTIDVSRGGASLPIAPFARIPSGSGSNLSYAPLPNGQLPPGQVAILFLSGSSQGVADGVPPCPAGVTTPAAAGDFPKGTGRGQAFHISVDRPVAAYDIWPYGGGNSAISSATLLIPTSAWDTNYMAIDAYPDRDPRANLVLGPWVSVVAASDDTEVSLTPTADIKGTANVAAATQGQKQTYMLSRGEVLTFLTRNELTGTPIQSSKPIGVFGGHNCMNVPVDAEACDAAHQQIPPIKALGHEYVVARYRDRYAHPEFPPVRIVGAVDKTTLSYDPAPPPDAPLTIDRGQTAEFRASTAFVVASQDDKHPFYVASYMTGCTAAAPNGYSGAIDDCRGDPEFVNVIPPQEYLSQYTFFTDPTYPETELVIVRARSKTGFEDVNLDCLGTIDGWHVVDAAGNYQFTRVELVHGNFEKVGGCDNGVHQMQSAAPFGVTVWGWGSAASGGTFAKPSASGFYSQAVSYAYPAGASVLPITNVVIPVN